MITSQKENLDFAVFHNAVQNQGRRFNPSQIEVSDAFYPEKCIKGWNFTFTPAYGRHRLQLDYELCKKYERAKPPEDEEEDWDRSWFLDLFTKAAEIADLFKETQFVTVKHRPTGLSVLGKFVVKPAGDELPVYQIEQLTNLEYLKFLKKKSEIDASESSLTG